MLVMSALALFSIILFAIASSVEDRGAEFFSAAERPPAPGRRATNALREFFIPGSLEKFGFVPDSMVFENIKTAKTALCERVCHKADSTQIDIQNHRAVVGTENFRMDGAGEKLRCTTSFTRIVCR